MKTKLARKEAFSLDAIGLEAAWPGAMFNPPPARIARSQRLGRVAAIGLAGVALAGLGTGFLLWHFVAGLPA